MREGSYVTPNLRLVRPLGRGGMGMVWIGHHEGLDTEVAVKFLVTESSDPDDPAIPRFKREAALSAKLKSPHVAQTFDHGVMDDGRPYIVMELLTGETLEARLACDTQLGTRHTATILTQIAQVLDEAHRLGVVHRDIKPDNVFLIDSGYDLFAKVLDFGIAKQSTGAGVKQMTRSGTIMGTPHYMSPEQLLSTRPVDAKADLWALAVVTYHCLTGRLPFHGETLAALSVEICKCRFHPPSVTSPLLSPFDHWFARAFDVDHEQRFASAGQMAKAFRDITCSLDDPVDGSTPTGQEPQPAADEGRRSDDAEEVSSPRLVALDGATPAESSVRPSFSEADSAPIGRRPAVTNVALAATTDATSPTFSGASANRVVEAKSNATKLKYGGIAVAAVVAAIVADLALRQPAPQPSQQTASVASVPSTAPTTSTSSSLSAGAPVSSAAPSGSQPASSATSVASPTTAPTQTKTTSHPHTRSTHPAPPKPDCTNPYVRQPDGTVTVKPHCL